MTWPWLFCWVSSKRNHVECLEEMAERYQRVQDREQRRNERCWSAALPVYHEEPS
jgi:hypothetical protein